MVMEVGPEGLWRSPSSDATPELGRGLWALGGLADAHAHFAAEHELDPGDPEGIRRRAFACLSGGTFMVIDKGWSDTTVVATLTSMSPTRAPDWEAAGRMLAVPDGYYPGFGVETDQAGLAAAVATAAVEGRGWVKLVGDWPRRGRGAAANFDRSDLETAVRVAHEGGARVAVHTMAPQVPTWAVQAGVDSIEHGLFLTPDDLSTLGHRGGGWVPTLSRMEGIADMLGEGSSGARLIRSGLDNVRSLLAEVPEGVAVMAGTDMALAPGDVSEEVLRLVAYGLDRGRAVAAGSDTVRAYMGRPSAFSTGSVADAVFFAADPWANPETLREPIHVLRAGALLT
jgi:imidazolonepropionase-like amidohydrolase